MAIQSNVKLIEWYFLPCMCGYHFLNSIKLYIRSIGNQSNVLASPLRLDKVWYCKIFWGWSKSRTVKEQHRLSSESKKNSETAISNPYVRLG